MTGPFTQAKPSKQSECSCGKPIEAHPWRNNIVSIIYLATICPTASKASYWYSNDC